MFESTFVSILTVDASKASATKEWLKENGITGKCRRDGEVVIFTLEFIPAEALAILGQRFYQ